VDSVSAGIINIVNTQLNGPSGLAVDGSGNLYVADNGNCGIVKFNPVGALTLVAGGSCGYSGDNGPATSAQLLYPSGVAVDTAGNIYIADTANSRIRKVTAPSATITHGRGNRCQRVFRPMAAPPLPWFPTN
jgi:DNA-binding beta-propeller fold protein YncE